MTLITTARLGARHWRRRHPTHLIPVLIGCVIAATAIALVVHLLRPTWEAEPTGDALRLPVSIGETLFNVPTHAIRVKVQKHSGPQERIDLSFIYPSLEAPDASKHISATAVDGVIQPIDRIFVSVFAHHDALAPDLRSRTIYPRYLEQALALPQDGLVKRAFREASPYSNEDLFSAEKPGFTARCTRDGVTPGICLSERRIDGADLTFRFPRGWLSQWREVAGAMERLTTQLRTPKS